MQKLSCELRVNVALPFTMRRDNSARSECVLNPDVTNG